MMFSVIANANESTTRLPCVEDHFSKLNALDRTNRLPPNPIGSCSYVAMSSLLMFYDAYWNENFVEDNYEWDQGTYNSNEDVLLETFNASSEATSWGSWHINNTGEEFTNDFHGFVEANEDVFLQPYLISLAKGWGYHQEDEAYGLSALEIVSVLRRYLYEIRGFDENEVSVCMKRSIDVGQTNFESLVKEQISIGNPVIYCGYSFDTSGLNIKFNATLSDLIGGHAMIAYSGYDNDSNIKLNNCWNSTIESNAYSDSESTPYVYWNVAIWLEINEENLPHMCSDAYYDTHTDSYMCACEIYCGTHPEGTHIKGTEYVSSVAGGHYKACVRCGESILENHRYNQYPYYNSIYHKAICDCGYETTAQHVINTTVGRVGVCIYCGETVFIGNGTVSPWGSNEEDEMY